MLHDYCALTGMPLSDGDDVVCLLRRQDALHTVWDGTNPADSLVRHILRGRYLQGWLEDQPRPAWVDILESVFLHGLAWDRVSGGEIDLSACDRVIAFAAGCGVHLPSVCFLKGPRNLFCPALLYRRLDIIDELSRRLFNG